MEKKTPLYQTHVDLGGKIVEFGGYLMPVQYPAGVIAEHMAVRQKSGLFDVSHMAELVVEGPDAVANIQALVTTDISKMIDGQVKYAMLCNDKGGIVDDLVIYRLHADKYMLVVNAGNHEKDAKWVEGHLFGDLKYEDISDTIGQLALQGPTADRILHKICEDQYIPKKYYTFIENGTLDLGSRKITAIISQTGYTGEHGYEIYCKAEDAADLWNALLRCGAEDGLIPCGLGARDTLRLEASMPLYGHEMNDEISPKEAGLPCKLDGKDFIGRDAIAARGEPKIKRAGFKVTGRGIVREHCDIYDKSGAKVGVVSSGTHCPYLGQCYGMCYLPPESIEMGQKFDVDVRGRLVEVELTPLPFYKAEK